MPHRKLWVCILPFASGLAWSQAQPAREGLHVGADVFAGYTYVSPDFGYYDQGGGESGVDGALDVRFDHFFAVAVDGGYLHKSYNPEESSSTNTLLAGPRFFFPLQRDSAIEPFADFLGGLTTFNWSSNSSSSPFTGTTSAAYAVDGGLDIRTTRHIWIRAQGGYLQSSFNSVASSLQNNVHNNHGRTAVGVVWRF
jgi:hypothetical protein